MINYFSGHIIIRTPLPINELAIILSNSLFGNIPFIEYKGGYYEEVHPYYLEKEVLGLEVLLQEAIDFEGMKQYSLSIHPHNTILAKQNNKTQFNIDLFLRQIAIEKLKDRSDINITDLR